MNCLELHHQEALNLVHYTAGLPALSYAYNAFQLSMTENFPYKYFPTVLFPLSSLRRSPFALFTLKETYFKGTSTIIKSLLETQY